MDPREKVAQKPAHGVHVRAGVGLCEAILLGGSKAPGTKLVVASLCLLGAKPCYAKVDEVGAIGGNHHV